jgi:hypothetical protein
MLQLRHGAAAPLRRDHAPKPYQGAADCLGFDPCDTSLVPKTWIVWGRPSSNECLVDVFCQVLGASILVEEAVGSLDQEEDGSLPSHSASRASIGSAYLAAYLVEQQQTGDEKGTFHQAIEALQRGDGGAESRQASTTYRKSTLASVAEGDDDRSALTPRQSHSSVREGHQRVHSPVEHVSPGGDTGHRIPSRRLRSSTTGPHQPRPCLSSPPAQRERSSSLVVSPALGNTMTSPLRSPLSSPLSPCGPEQRSPTLLSPYLAQTVLQDAATKLTTRGRGANHRRLTRVAEGDDDLFMYYGAMLEEHIRLSNMVDKAVT